MTTTLDTSPPMGGTLKAQHALDAKYTLTLFEELPQGLADEFRTVPGIAVWNKRPGLTVPYNAGWLVKDVLRAAKIRFTGRVNGVHEGPTFKEAHDAALAVGALSPDYWSKWTVPFQRDVVCARYLSGGGTMHAPGGSGKTSMMLALSAVWQAPTVFLGPARVLGQWEQEAANPSITGPRFLFYGWRPESAMRKKDTPIDEYLERCREEGVPPRVYLSHTLPPERMGLLSEILSWGGMTGALIVDEIHAFKAPDRLDWTITYNDVTGEEEFESAPTNNRSSLAWQLAHQAFYRLGATATPISVGIDDLWGQMSMPEPHAWGQTASRFKQRYADMVPGPFGGFKARESGTGYAHLDELKKRLMFTRSLVPLALTHAQLPPMRRRRVIVPLSEQVKETGGWKRELAALRRKDAPEGSDFRLGELHRMRAASRKRAFVANHIVEAVRSGENVLVFTGRIQDAEELHALVATRLKHQMHKGHRLWLAHGQMSADDREDIRREYMAFAPGVGGALIGTWHALGESYNLHNTHRLMFAMLPGTPRELLQGEWRAYRLGMKFALLVEYFIAEGSYDERIQTTLLERLPVVEKIGDPTSIEGLEAALTEANVDMHKSMIDYFASLEGTPSSIDDD